MNIFSGVVFEKIYRQHKGRRKTSASVRFWYIRQSLSESSSSSITTCGTSSFSRESADITLPKMTFSFKPYKELRLFLHAVSASTRSTSPKERRRQETVRRASLPAAIKRCARRHPKMHGKKIDGCGIFLIFPHPIASFAHKSHAAKQICNP